MGMIADAMKRREEMLKARQGYLDYLNGLVYGDKKARKKVAMGEPESALPRLLHRIGAVSVWKDPNGGYGDYSLVYYLASGGGGDYVARLAIAGVDEHECRAATPRDALRGLRRYCPKTYKKRGEITAYRCWKLSGGYLMPLTDFGKGKPFTGPILEADVVPEMTSDSGLYSVKEEGQPWLHSAGYQHDAYGVVGLYGRVIEHENGYRSQYQVIRKVVLLGEYPPWFVKGIADTYQCDVTVEARHPLASANYASLLGAWNAQHTQMAQQMQQQLLMQQQALGAVGGGVLGLNFRQAGAVPPGTVIAMPNPWKAP